MANEKRRLIDANALMDAFRKNMADRYDRNKCVSEENCKTCEPGCSWRKVVAAAPTVDAVEVVRCKDCKNFCKAGGLLDYDYCNQMYDCDGTHSEVYPDDFCSYGERREGE